MKFKADIYLRDINMIESMKYINTQVAEQTFAQLKKEIHWATKIKAKSFFFLIRLILHLQNEDINGSWMNQHSKKCPEGMYSQNKYYGLWAYVRKKLNLE